MPTPTPTPTPAPAPTPAPTPTPTPTPAPTPTPTPTPTPAPSKRKVQDYRHCLQKRRLPMLLHSKKRTTSVFRISTRGCSAFTCFSPAGCSPPISEHWLKESRLRLNWCQLPILDQIAPDVTSNLLGANCCLKAVAQHRDGTRSTKLLPEERTRKSVDELF